MKKKEPTLEDMKREIAKAGGMFYQYRPCRRDMATIYDIENIRHGVVYAQTPLNMNDPFDSMIGFSPEKFYDNVIQLLLEAISIEDQNIKIVMGEMLKYKILGKMADFLSILNSLRKYLLIRQVAMHQTGIDGSVFVLKNLSVLYSKCPKDIKKGISKEMFVIFSVLVLQLDKNTCWNYEKEWRIINVGQANTPLFINLPYIKSITFGLNIDSVCKRLLWDVCKQNGIECYALCTNTENYVLERKKLTDADFVFDLDDETEYAINLFHQIEKNLKEISLKGPTEEEEIDFSKLSPMIADTIDAISNLYYLKAALNRICENVKEDEYVEIPDSLIENIIQLDMFIEQVKNSTPSIQESIPNLLLGGQISQKDYNMIQKQLKDINELIDKYENREWNTLLIKGCKEDIF